MLTIFDSSGSIIATDAGWGNAPTFGSSSVQAVVASATAAIKASVGALDLPANSSDSALVLTLPSGTAYTAQVTGLNSTSGTGLVEIYELTQ